MCQDSVMDVDGSVLYEISAEAIEERPDENQTILSGVFVRYSPMTDVPWEVSAASGVIPSDERFIEQRRGRAQLAILS